MAINNPLELIEDLIATDSRDWFEDYRSAMIYSIILGLDDEDGEKVMQECRERFNFTEETVKSLDDMHKEWTRLKNLLINNQNNISYLENGGETPTTLPKR